MLQNPGHGRQSSGISRIPQPLNYLSISLVLFFVISNLAGCASPRIGSWPAQTGGAPVHPGGWQVDTYENSCLNTIAPRQPSCLNYAQAVGFKYQDQFQACRKNMINFTTALDEYYDCADTKLRAIFDDLFKRVPDLFNCYVRFFNDKKEGDPSFFCLPLEAPKFRPHFAAKGLELRFGIPQCLRKIKGYDFAPKESFDLHDCRRQMQIFMGETKQTYSLSAVSAQVQYDTYQQNLRQKLDRSADDAIRKFNCVAERRTNCE